jgi:hypothetical protein
METCAKKWLTSKTIVTSGVAVGVAAATLLGAVDSQTADHMESALIPLITIFLRLGNREPVS